MHGELEIAFNSLESDNLIVYEEGGYYTLNFTKTDEVKAIVFDDIEDDLYMSQPLESELEDLVFQFVTESGREYPREQNIIIIPKGRTSLSGCL